METLAAPIVAKSEAYENRTPSGDGLADWEAAMEEVAEIWEMSLALLVEFGKLAERYDLDIDYNTDTDAEADKAEVVSKLGCTDVEIARYDAMGETFGSTS